jgi:hypothetical protein
MLLVVIFYYRLKHTFKLKYSETRNATKCNLCQKDLPLSTVKRYEFHPKTGEQYKFVSSVQTQVTTSYSGMKSTVSICNKCLSRAIFPSILSSIFSVNGLVVLPILIAIFPLFPVGGAMQKYLHIHLSVLDVFMLLYLTLLTFWCLWPSFYGIGLAANWFMFGKRANKIEIGLYKTPKEFNKLISTK